MKHAIVYVPGLGDHRPGSQKLAIATWRIYGVHTKLVALGWQTAESFDSKLSRLLDEIDSLAEAGYQVSLVGVSAGASAVINAYAERPGNIHHVVCICGKLRNAQTIGKSTFARNPAFAESLERLPSSLEQLSTAQRQAILSIRPLADGTVPPEDTIVEGAQSKILPTSGHVASIAAAITIYSFSIVRFLRT